MLRSIINQFSLININGAFYLREGKIVSPSTHEVYILQDKLYIMPKNRTAQKIKNM